MIRLFATVVIAAMPIFAFGMPALYTKQDSMTICRLLKSAQNEAQPPKALFFARTFLGVPYVGSTLEVCDSERLIVNTRQMDCTTLIETVTALTLCSDRGQTSFRDYIETLTMLRYHDGIINGYASRLHYFTEWIADNSDKGLVEEISGSNPPFSSVQTVRAYYMSEHPQMYKALKNNPGIVPLIRKAEKAITGMKCRFIPKSQLRDSGKWRDIVHDGDILAITTNKKGLEIAHLGFAVWHNDGELHLLNASSIHKRVIDEPMTLYSYLMKHPSHTGIRIIRIKNQKPTLHSIGR